MKFARLVSLLMYSSFIFPLQKSPSPQNNIFLFDQSFKNALKIRTTFIDTRPISEPTSSFNNVRTLTTKPTSAFRAISPFSASLDSKSPTEDSEIISINFNSNGIEKKAISDVQLSRNSTPLSSDIFDLKNTLNALIYMDFIAKCANRDGVITLADINKPDLDSLNLKEKGIENILEDCSQLLEAIGASLTVKKINFNTALAATIKLTTLNLSNNNISQIPVELCDIETLKNLDISHNKLSSLPEQIDLLENLQKLDVSYNDILDLPESINQLSKLKELHLIGNKNLKYDDCFFTLLSCSKLDMRSTLPHLNEEGENKPELYKADSNLR